MMENTTWTIDGFEIEQRPAGRAGRGEYGDRRLHRARGGDRGQPGGRLQTRPRRSTWVRRDGPLRPASTHTESDARATHYGPQPRVADQSSGEYVRLPRVRATRSVRPVGPVRRDREVVDDRYPGSRLRRSRQGALAGQAHDGRGPARRRARRPQADTAAPVALWLRKCIKPVVGPGAARSRHIRYVQSGGLHVSHDDDTELDVEAGST